jgi:hypothetical protein
LRREGIDEVVFRGDVGKREFVAFWLSGGRVLVDTGALRDPERPLESLTGR